MAKNKSTEKFKEFLDNLMFKLGLKKRKKIKYDRTQASLKRIFEEGELEFYEAYSQTADVVMDIDELIPKEGLLGKSSQSLTEYVIKSSMFPSKKDYQYIGVSDLKKYFLSIIIKAIGAGVLIFIISAISMDIVGGIINGLIVTILLVLGGIYYPKIKLLLFRGEIKLQILMAILHIISMLDSGASLQEAMKNIASSSEYGVVSYEFKAVIFDIVRGGYSFAEALERGRQRTGITLMKKLFTQLIAAANQGRGQVLLENLYKEIVRESISKIDNSKFQISNLGNLVFGTGIILPFAGMLQGALTGGSGFEGINNTVDLVLTKIGPMSTIMFAIFVKMKIE
jgi:flagellar protein FlaJ